MNPFDDQVARAVFTQLLRSARDLTFFEMAQLKGAYSGTTSYDQLSDALKRKFRDLGAAALTASGRK